MKNLLLFTKIEVLIKAVVELENDNALKISSFGVYGKIENKDYISPDKQIDLSKIIERGLIGDFDGVDLRHFSIDLLNDLAWVETIVYPMMDRIDSLKTQTCAQRRRLYQYILCYWLEFLDQNRIDVAIFGCAPHEVTDFLFYVLCKVKNINTLVFNYTRLPGFCFVGNDYSYRVIEDFKDIKPESYQIPLSVYQYIQSIRNDYKSAIPIDTSEILKIAENSVLKPSSSIFINWIKIFKITFRKVKTFAGLIRNLEYKSARDFINYKINKDEWHALKKEYRFRTNNFKKPISYVYFLLNFQPESTTSPLADKFVDQYIAIAMIAKNLPKNCAILVKEHPGQLLEFGHYNSLGRDLKFYQRISNIPNIVWCPFNHDHFDLIDSSIFVASINGTVGWEAVVRCKPALVFGNSWYQSAPGVFKIDTDNDCIRAINEIFRGIKLNDAMVDSFLKNFLTHCYEICLTEEDARISRLHFDLDQNIKKAKEVIIKHLTVI